MLPATQPLVGKSSSRHAGDVISESDPFLHKIQLGQNFLTQITTPFTPKLADGAAPHGSGVAIPGITDGFRGKAPDMGAIITGVPAPTWGDRSFLRSANASAAASTETAGPAGSASCAPCPERSSAT